MLKLGAQGCFFKNTEERFFTDPFVVSPVDTTGCGDNFAAAFIHGILKGMTHKECTEFACGAGALNSQGIGAHMVIRSEQQVLDFMKNIKAKYKTPVMFLTDRRNEYGKNSGVYWNGCGIVRM